MSRGYHMVTGATGLLGSHIVEQLAAAGKPVLALVRQSSNRDFLDRLGVETRVVDYGDVEALIDAVADATVVYHCAARVSDWGPWPVFQRELVDVAERVLLACERGSVGRVLFVSSISVYGHPKPGPDEFIDEEAPLNQNPWLWDHYARAKIAAEQIAQRYPRPITIVRPSWLYGERDRVTIPRVVQALRSGKVAMIGRGDNVLNLVYAGDVARGCILAAECEAAAGRIYNLSSRGELTQKQMVDTLTEALGLPPVRRRVPFWLVRSIAFMQEAAFKAIRSSKPPRITRRAIYLIGRPARFSIERARQELGWEPRVSIREGVARTLQWFFAWEQQQAEAAEEAPLLDSR